MPPACGNISSLSIKDYSEYTYHHYYFYNSHANLRQRISMVGGHWDMWPEHSSNIYFYSAMIFLKKPFR